MGTVLVLILYFKVAALFFGKMMLNQHLEIKNKKKKIAALGSNLAGFQFPVDNYQHNFYLVFYPCYNLYTVSFPSRSTTVV